MSGGPKINYIFTEEKKDGKERINDDVVANQLLMALHVLLESKEGTNNATLEIAIGEVKMRNGQLNQIKIQVTSDKVNMIP